MPAKHFVQLSLQRKPNRHQWCSGSGQDPLSTQGRGARAEGATHLLAPGKSGWLLSARWQFLPREIRAEVLGLILPGLPTESN